MWHQNLHKLTLMIVAVLIRQEMYILYDQVSMHVVQVEHNYSTQIFCQLGYCFLIHENTVEPYLHVVWSIELMLHLHWGGLLNQTNLVQRHLFCESPLKIIPCNISLTRYQCSVESVDYQSVGWGELRGFVQQDVCSFSIFPAALIKNILMLFQTAVIAATN